MPQGRPKKWATAWIEEPIYLGKRGIRIKVWDKYGRTHRGFLLVSVGGIRWVPRGKQKARPRISWDRIAKMR